MFDIDVSNMHWIDGTADDPKDLCLHGDAVAIVGDERFEYGATVSATALYLLRTVTENHIMGESNQMLPHCGHAMYANKETDSVDIVDCIYGIDWSVIQDGDNVKLITEAGNSTVVRLSDYVATALGFADKIEAFYHACSPKILPDDEIDKAGYIAFWNEWNRRKAAIKERVCQSGIG